MPLALERVWECEILSDQKFEGPVLDIGCGEGIFAKILFKDKIDVGIDPQQSEVDRASTYGIYNELIVCYGDKIPKESGSFNTIFSNSVLEHIQDLEPVMVEANRLLSKSGSFYITVPTEKFDEYSTTYQVLNVLGLKGFAARFKLFFNNFWRHYHYHNLDGWKKLASKTGFKVVNQRVYCSKFQGLLNNFLAPLSISSFIQKKIANKWFVIPFIRKMYVPFLSLLFASFAKVPSQINEGGIVFFHLKKDNE